MKILYLSQQKIDLNSSGIYSDLINSLMVNGHNVTVLSAFACERNELKRENNVTIINVKIANQYGVNKFKKGLILLKLQGAMIKAIKRHLNNEQFDLVLYSTPPITFAKVVKYSKKRFNCKSYLMLKDIFPQNAVDIGLMSTGGLSGILFKMLKKQETELYKVSDRIGCMSAANINYLLKNEKYLSLDKIELFPNSIKVIANKAKNKDALIKYNIDTNKMIFIYGGNLGKPQGLDFLAKGIERLNNNEKAHFIIIGNGSEKAKLFEKLRIFKNVTLLDSLPTSEYLELARNCDVGLVMLDHRFTIPNYPSRILAYMENEMPILACTDKATDVKELVEEQANCGKWCYSDDLTAFENEIQWFIENSQKLKELGLNGRRFLEEHFNVEKCVKKLEKFFIFNKHKNISL